MLCDTGKHGERPARSWKRQTLLIWTSLLNLIFIIFLNYFVVYVVYYTEMFVNGVDFSFSSSGFNFFLTKNLTVIVFTWLLHVFSIMLLWSIAMSMTDPGYFTEGREPILSKYLNHSIAILQPYERERYEKWTKPKFCYSCNYPKPPRSHHCSACERWVLKMDHHWNWISNWVGYRNHKFFVLMLFYYIITLALFLGLTITMLCTYYVYQILIVTIIVGLIFLHILRIFVRQIRLIRQNMTSVEELLVDPSPFDFGVWENVKQVMGENYWLWPIPIRQKLPGTGYSFDVNLEKIP